MEFQSPAYGTVLGGFRIERRLGGGGMGEVFLATQLALDRKVALKILPPAITRDPELSDDFAHEMRTLAKLDHPNVATAFAAGEDDGVHFLAMAYIDGEDLAERVEREGALPEAGALHCVYEVAKALDYAWDKYQLLHRDLKPGNIMIDRDGVVKLVDMGLSKTLYEDLSTSLPDRIIGTPNYMSPEQARGEIGLSVGSDIFALGATLYHLVTGQPPFEGEDPEEVLDAVQSGPPLPARELRPDLSPACAQLIETMTARDPDQRYAAWDEVMTGIEHALAGGAGTSRRAGDAPGARVKQVHVDRRGLAAHEMREPTRPGSVRIRKALATSVAVLLVAAGGVGIGLLTRARHQAVEKEPYSAEERAAALQTEARRKTVEATIATAEVNRDLNGALAELRALRKTIDDAPLARQLTEAMWGIEAAKKKAVADLLTGLQYRADVLTGSGDYAAAALMFSSYAGPYAADTLDARSAQAAAITATGRRAEEERRRQRQVRFQALRQRTIAAALDGDAASAAADLQAALENDLSPEQAAEAEQLLTVLREIEQMPALVLGAYRKYLGRETTVYFRNGEQRVKIVAVSEDQVKSVYHGPDGEVARDFGIRDLGLREKVVRLGRARRPDLDLIRGLLAYQGGREKSACRYLELADHDFGQLLLQMIDDRRRNLQRKNEEEETSP